MSKTGYFAPVKKRRRRNVILSPPKIRLCSYKVFLRSRYWKYVRRLVMKRDGYICVMCGCRDKLQVHHLSYEHHYSEHLWLGDMVTLCDGCHRWVHGKNGNVKKLCK